MFINTRFLVLGLIVSSFFLPVSTTLAQTAGNTQVEQMPETFPSIFRRDHYQVEFLDKPNNSVSKFTLRLSSFGQLSGCASMTKSKVETKDAPETVSVEVKDSEVRLDKKIPRYTNYDCKIKQNKSYFDIVLDRDELIDNGVKYIKLTSEKYGEFTTSEVDVNKERFILKVPTADGEIHLTYWFLPENTVILSTPYAKSGTNTVELLKNFALGQGLKAADQYFDGYIPPHHIENRAIFIDKWNRVIPHFDPSEKQQIVGQISPTRTVYGVNGPVEEPYELDVYASMPEQSAALIKK